MAIEIERKFLLVGEGWRRGVTHRVRMAQAYLAGGKGQPLSARVRIAGEQAHLNLKSAVRGASRAEFEYPLPMADAEAMMALAGGAQIDKTRHYLPWGELCWEIDEFHGRNAGLIVAEIELPSVATAFERPDWLGAEVTEDLRYYNSALAQHPYQDWSSSA